MEGVDATPLSKRGSVVLALGLGMAELFEDPISLDVMVGVSHSLSCLLTSLLYLPDTDSLSLSLYSSLPLPARSHSPCSPSCRSAQAKAKPAYRRPAGFFGGGS